MKKKSLDTCERCHQGADEQNDVREVIECTLKHSGDVLCTTCAKHYGMERCVVCRKWVPFRIVEPIITDAGDLYLCPFHYHIYTQIDKLTIREREEVMSGEALRT